MDLTGIQQFIEANGDALALIGPLAGATIGFAAGYVIRGGGPREKVEPVQLVECTELINTRVLDMKILGPDASTIHIRAGEAGPETEQTDVTELYLARFRFRNLSVSPVDKLFVNLDNAPRAIWFSLAEGEGHHSPDWEDQRDRILEATRLSEDMSWRMFPLPYLNPYSATKHEVILDIASYLSLEEVGINGGARGIDFVFRKLEKS
ncbi:MAG: hypothetical protein GKC10_09270 [Methanosarcinales archaeon]|nr:hypothetical protein [Methanosarcinales archaeon]